MRSWEGFYGQGFPPPQKFKRDLIRDLMEVERRSEEVSREGLWERGS